MSDPWSPTFKDGDGVFFDIDNIDIGDDMSSHIKIGGNDELCYTHY